MIISGYLQDEARVMTAGANHYLIKPADPAEQLALIEQSAAG